MAGSTFLRKIGRAFGGAGGQDTLPRDGVPPQPTSEGTGVPVASPGEGSFPGATRVSTRIKNQQVQAFIACLFCAGLVVGLVVLIFLIA